MSESDMYREFYLWNRPGHIYWNVYGVTSYAPEIESFDAVDIPHRLKMVDHDPVFTFLTVEDATEFCKIYRLEFANKLTIAPRQLVESEALDHLAFDF